MRPIAIIGVCGALAVALLSGVHADSPSRTESSAGRAPAAIDSVGTAVDSAQVAITSDSLGTEELRSRVVVYYFHPTIRCESCLKLESLTHDALEVYFPEELARGQVQWQVYDFESPAGARLAGSFETEGSTITVADLLGTEVSRWKNLDDAWYLLDEPDSLKGYVRNEVRAYLGAGR